MAIDIYQFEQIVSTKVTGRALSAGYPDLLVHFLDAPARKDSDAVRAHHNNFKYPIAESVDVFREMGLELEVIDREKLQGCERIFDLNNILALDEYDLVIDPGTSEHCFNIPQALINLADAVKIGGFISQALPMSMFNHGYWNVNPVALIDFYELNGFEILKFVIRHDEEIFSPKPEDRGRRMVSVPEDSVNLLLAKRLEKKLFRWPQQKLP